MTLPPWIASIDPVAPVAKMLQGYSTGAQIGESLRQGEQHAADQADANSRFEAELAQREALAQQQYQLHAELQKEKAEAAARSLAGMQEYQSLVAAGMPKERALMQAAPNLFYKQPDKLMNALHEFQLEAHQQAMEKQAASSAARMEAGQQAQVKHWDRTATEQERANKEREKRLSEPKPPVELVTKDIPGFGTVLVNPKTGTMHTKTEKPSPEDFVEKTKAAAAARVLFSPNADDETKTNALKVLDAFTKRGKAAPKVGMGDLKAAEQSIPEPATAKRIRVREKKTGKLGWWEGGSLPSEYEPLE